MPFQDGAIELRKPTSAIHFTAPCGMQFSFGAKFTQPKKKRNENMDKVYNIDEIFGCTNVKVQAIPTEHLGCSGCFFDKTKFPYCFKPSYIGSCEENGQNFIFIKLNNI